MVPNDSEFRIGNVITHKFVLMNTSSEDIILDPVPATLEIYSLDAKGYIAEINYNKNISYTDSLGKKLKVTVEPKYFLRYGFEIKAQ